MIKDCGLDLAAMFNETIIVDGHEMQRFEYLAPTADELAQLK